VNRSLSDVAFAASRKSGTPKICSNVRSVDECVYATLFE